MHDEWFIRYSAVSIPSGPDFCTNHILQWGVLSSNTSPKKIAAIIITQFPIILRASTAVSPLVKEKGRAVFTLPEANIAPETVGLEDDLFFGRVYGVYFAVIIWTSTATTQQISVNSHHHQHHQHHQHHHHHHQHFTQVSMPFPRNSKDSVKIDRSYHSFRSSNLENPRISAGWFRLSGCSTLYSHWVVKKTTYHIIYQHLQSGAN